MAKSNNFLERMMIAAGIRVVLDDMDREVPQGPANAEWYRYWYHHFKEKPLMRLVMKDILGHQYLLDHIQKNGHCYDDPALKEQPKCASRAAQMQRKANELCGSQMYVASLRMYNMSICHAPTGSEVLAIGYAKRSAVLYELKEYHLALASIVVAKSKNYPERLMPELLERETMCRKMIDDNSLKENATSCTILAFSLASNERIPFLAKEIFARKLPEHGDNMLAKATFDVGDVILQEKAMKGSVCISSMAYMSCSNCLAEECHFIPCPNCISVMYCSEACLTEAQEIHRFECGVTAELRIFDCRVGPRMFFYGLTLFDNDVKKMMEFFTTHNESGATFFNDVDYSNYDAREEFKAFIGPKAPTNALQPFIDNVLQYASAIIYTIYQKVPLVQTLVTGKKEQDFMLQCFYQFMALMDSRSIHASIEGQLYPIASSFKQSNEPNAVAVSFAGQLKLIVLRPIRRGERILVSYDTDFDLSHQGKIRIKLAAEEVAADQLKNAGLIAGKDRQKMLQYLQGVIKDGNLKKDLSNALSSYRLFLGVVNKDEIKIAQAKKLNSEGIFN